MARAQFLVSPDHLQGAGTKLTGAELHHLRVRRLRPGEEVVLIDGEGHRRLGVLEHVDRTSASVRFTERGLPPSESTLRIVLAMAVIKPDRFELAVEKTTELGVSEIVPFRCHRTQAHRTEGRLSRLQRIAAAAVKQSLRDVVPTISRPVPFSSVVGRETEALRLLLWEGPAEVSLSRVERDFPTCNSLLLIVGPEGGFTPIEVDLARDAGILSVGLGRRILRAESAAIAAVALAQFLWGDMGQ